MCDGLVAHVVRLLVVADGDGGAVDESGGDERAGDAREAGDGLRDAEHAALLARARALRRERCERGRCESIADGEGRADAEERRESCLRPRQGNDEQARSEEERADNHERNLAEHLHEPTDESALNTSADDADEGEYPARVVRVEAEAVERKQPERGGHYREGHDEEEVYDEHEGEARAV